MLSRLNAPKKLYLLLVVTSASIIGIGVYGGLEMKKMYHYTQTLYVDRVFPLQQLTRSRDSYSYGILVTAQRIMSRDISYIEGLKIIGEAEKKIAEDWKGYMQTYLTPQEKHFAQQWFVLMQRSTATLQKLKVVLKKDDSVATQTFITGELHPAMGRIINKINQLIALQVQIGGEVYNDSKQTYQRAQLKFLFLIISSLTFAVAFSYYLIQTVRDLIKNLKKSKDKYYSLIAHANDPVFLLNKSGSFIEVNECMCQLLGYTEEELLTMGLSDLFTAEQLQRTPLQLELLEKNKTLLLEKKWLKKDGTTADVEINTRVFEGIGYLAIARDISNRLRTDQVLRESERKYRNIFENVQDAFFQTDLDGVIIELSPSITRHLGYTQQELIGSYAADLYANPKDREYALEILGETGELKDYQVSFKSKSGDAIFVVLNVRLIPCSDELPGHFDGSLRNITEKKRIENELAEHKQLLDIFIEHSPASLAMFDTNMKYIATSNKWMIENDILGQNLVGKNHYEIFPDLPQHFKDGHKRSLQGAIEKNEEDSFINPDGTLEWIRWENRPWYKESGKIGGIIMLTEVITERKNATELFKQQFENSPDTILIVNRDLKIESMNRGVPGGRAFEEIIGMDCIEILPKESQGISRRSIMRCLETGVTQESEIRLGNGSLVRARFVPIAFHGEISRVMIIATDITEQRIAEEKQKKSEEKHRALIENISDTIILINKQYEITYQSPSFVRSAGFSLEELGDKTVLDFIHPADLQKCKDDLQKAALVPGIPQNINYQILHKEGHYIWIEGTITNLIENDSVNAYIVIYRDITQRKGDEQRLRLAYERSKKQLEFITDLIWKQSHILRGPLANLKGLSLIIEQDPGDITTLRYFMTELDAMDGVLRKMAEDAAKNVID
ncbi:PAS domain S-box protein [Pedobacter psychroterrae]|uniref:histidine kinase n=1 Tax=Pedobacter psychroterrae TaxID=2530453 RepID=A0A4R0NEN3_9SPHI|nr:PAS domain S-box protein [Pedobacter psychroterrae]TCC98167.1 PAS domain S-box protein [Pedobacter psychroterrae]